MSTAAIMKSPAGKTPESGCREYCAWCRPAYSLAADFTTSSGMCADCLEKLASDLKKRAGRN